MKKQFFLFGIISLIALLSCNSDDNCISDDSNVIREKYLVDKIVIYITPSKSSLTEYIYDSENKLIQKVTTGTITEGGKERDSRYEHDFEYEDNLVSKIRIKDLTHYEFSHDIHLFYDSEKKLIRQETWMNGVMIRHFNFHYENNLMVSVYDDTTEPFETNTIFYDTKGNVTKHLYIVPKTDLMGYPIPGEYQEKEHTYEYDNGLKPNFGIDDLFVYEALPGIGVETNFARWLSSNNLSKYVNSGTTWDFTYNEFGLPESFEMKWKDTETTYPMLWNISYKEIK